MGSGGGGGGGFEEENLAMMWDWQGPGPGPGAGAGAGAGPGPSGRALLWGCVSEESHNPKKDKQRGGGLVERMAARAGFNAPRLNTDPDPQLHSPCFTIPPGLSPTTLLESPVFLSNSLAHPSPTTGKFSFLPDLTTNTHPSVAQPPDASSFAFMPLVQDITPPTLPLQSFRGNQVSVHSENSFQTRDVEEAKVPPHNGHSLDFPRLTSERQQDNAPNLMAPDPRALSTVSNSAEHSPPLEDQPDDEEDQGAGGDSMMAGAGGAPSEDGYNWRKYGQKQVKGSEYPRSYYKCTYSNCPVKKKVERSHEGHITEIIYKGAHNHPKPPPNRRAAIGSANLLTDMPLDLPEQPGLQSVPDNDQIWASTQKGAMGNPNWRHDNVEVTSSASMGPEFGNISSIEPAQNGSYFESGDAVDASYTFSNEEEEDEQATHGSVAYDGEEDESESKRRKLESYTAAEMGGATRAIREPRVVVQTTSEVDILDDGYRWRKYGQKVVKGNPNPRSYYKCTSAGCTVRKHVERASHDLKSVITTYEGKHNHDVPAARNSSHVNSGNTGFAPSQAAPNHMQRPEKSQVHNSMAWFNRPAASFGAFGVSGRPQLGPSPSFNYGMSQPSLANLPMAGLGPGQPKMHVMPVHQFVPQQHPGNEMGFMLPKGEPKVEPVTEPALNLSANSSVYQEIMGRLPLGPQM